MAKSERPKPSPEERLQKSLAAAAKILNKQMHHVAKVERDKPVKSGLRAAEAAEVNAAEANLDLASPAELVLYQVWCPDEDKVVSSPTTDKRAAMRARDRHNASTGHLSRILASD